MLGSPDGASLERALALERAGDDLRALGLLEELVRDRPQWELPRIEAARLLLKRGEALERAELHLEAARALAPENPRGHFLWGLLMQERGSLAEAARSLEVALYYRSGYDEARFRLAGIYFSMGEWEKSEGHYAAYARAHPEATGARLQLAAAMERQGRLGEAEAELRRLVAQKPPVLLAVQRLSDLYERTGRPELAEKLNRTLPGKRKKMRELGRSGR